MLFNSIEFGLFVIIVFFLYWFIFQRSLKLQNLFLLIASYIFYGWWDWRFLLLIGTSSSVDYLVGLGLANKGRSKSHRKRLLWISIIVNIGLLGFFKYYNFFIDSFVQAFTFFGHHLEPSRLGIILPIGISFYTLQTLSYTIDVYYGKLKPTKNIVSFFAFVSFFPQLVAGPIERATSLLPQMESRRTFEFDEAKDGLRQMLWGFFKKIVIADNCAVYIAQNLMNVDSSGSTLLLSACLGSIQFYCDFSGYSDIAIGTARLFGFKLMKNFNFPFFSRDIAEFWRRWHISLLSWIGDYVIKPLGGLTVRNAVRNIFIVFILTGLWHGAHWKFILWGFVQFLFFIPYLVFGRRRKKVGRIVAQGKVLPSILEVYQMSSTFLLFTLSGLLFFCSSVSDAFNMFFNLILDWSLFSLPAWPSKTILLSVIILFIIEWLQRTKEHGLEDIGQLGFRPIRWIFYYSIIFSIIYFGGHQQEFIYFQF